jgi:hypothetical protein
MALHHALFALVASPWTDWPTEAYRRPAYILRLQAVQDHLATCLREMPEGPIRVVSLCAGDGRDTVGVLETHERREDVAAWLVELDAESVQSGIQRSNELGMGRQVTFINGDATDFKTYSGILPCNIVLVCGVFGHVPSRERKQFTRALTKFCTPGSSVIWTRGIKGGGERITAVREAFAANSFAEVRETITPDGRWLVCTHRYTGELYQAPASGRIFNFRRKSGA